MKNRIISKAPARICLFGDHQDYLGLPVIACAIDKYMIVEGEFNPDMLLHFNLIDLNKKVSINVNEDIIVIKKGDHIKAVIKTLRTFGCYINSGMDIKVQSDIYINAGISSSSAFTVSLVNFFIKAFGINREINNELIAEIAYHSEVIEQEGSGGKMDQYSIVLGDTIFLETGSRFSYKEIDSGFSSFIIANSGIKKNTDGVLKKLKNKAIDAIGKVQKFNSKFDILKCKNEDMEAYSKILDNESFVYFKAAVENHHITLKALKEMENSNTSTKVLGELMNLHHNILKNKLKITVPKIDQMIDAANLAGAYGSKIIGSGCGGSIVVVSNIKNEKKIMKSILEAGAIDVSRVKISKGIF
ncbi:MAG: mevalonate kinase family protein [Flavobacteriales bacterium]